MNDEWNIHQTPHNWQQYNNFNLHILDGQIEE